MYFLWNGLCENVGSNFSVKVICINLTANTRCLFSIKAKVLTLRNSIEMRGCSCLHVAPSLPGRAGGFCFRCYNTWSDLISGWVFWNKTENWIKTKKSFYESTLHKTHTFTLIFLSISFFYVIFPLLKQ